MRLIIFICIYTFTQLTLCSSSCQAFVTTGTATRTTQTSVFLHHYSCIPTSLSTKSTSTSIQMNSSNGIPKIINSLNTASKLSNTYYVLRHGQSKANIAKIISSDPVISTKEHGLTSIGRDQVQTSAMKFCNDYHNNRSGSASGNVNVNDIPVAIYSSDFTRARETANIFANVLKQNNVPLLTGASASANTSTTSSSSTIDEHEYTDNSKYVQLEKRLRERYFGTFNNRSDEHYQDVWDIDCTDPNHTEYDVESVNSVVRRTSSLIMDIEGLNLLDGTGCKVILVAHGDVLQILQTAFLKVDGSVHRSLKHLETASVREMKLNSN